MSNLHPSSAEFDAHQRQSWLGPTEVLGVLAVALLADSAPAILGRLQQSRTETSSTPEVFECEGGSSKAVLYYPGCNQDCTLEAKKAAKVFGDLAHVITPVYDKYNISPKSIADQMVGACEDLGVDEIVIVGGSMGLGISMRTALQPKFRNRFLSASGMIGNAGVVEQSNIALTSRALLRGAKTFRYSSAVDRAYAAIAARRGKSVNIGQRQIVVPRLPKMPPREISKYAHAVTSHLTDGCLRGFVEPENLWFIDNLLGEENRDKVTISERSFADIERVTGFAPQVIRDPHRPPRSHVAGFQHPTTLRQPVEWSLYPERRPVSLLEQAA